MTAPRNAKAPGRDSEGDAHSRSYKNNPSLADATVRDLPGGQCVACLAWYESGIEHGLRLGHADGFREGFLAGAAHFRQQMDVRAGLTGYGNFLLPPWSDLLERAGVEL